MRHFVLLSPLQIWDLQTWALQICFRHCSQQHNALCAASLCQAQSVFLSLISLSFAVSVLWHDADLLFSNHRIMTGLDCPSRLFIPPSSSSASYSHLCLFLQAWKTGTCYHMIWTAFSYLNQRINWAPIRCDNAQVQHFHYSFLKTRCSHSILAGSWFINPGLYNTAKVHAVAVAVTKARCTSSLWTTV